MASTCKILRARTKKFTALKEKESAILEEEEVCSLVEARGGGGFEASLDASNKTHFLLGLVANKTKISKTPLGSWHFFAGLNYVNFGPSFFKMLFLEDSYLSLITNLL